MKAEYILIIKKLSKISESSLISDDNAIKLEYPSQKEKERADIVSEMKNISKLLMGPIRYHNGNLKCLEINDNKNY